MRNRLVLFAAAAAALVTVAACEGGEESPRVDEQTEVTGNEVRATDAGGDHEAIMKARHDHYEEMGDAMKAIGAQLKAESPSLPIVRRNAALIAGYAPQVPNWFPEGSGPETGRRTRAKAEIWSDPETFRQRAQAFEQAAARFDAAARSGDLAAIRNSQEALGETCKDCHDRFRGPEKD